MKTEEKYSRPIKEDVIVTIAGPIQHVVIYCILLIVNQLQLVPDEIVQIAFYYNALILIFNLLPIYPLDGGKLLFYFLSTFLPFRTAHTYILCFSILTCIAIVLLQFFFLPFTLSALLLIVFLLLENRLEWKNRYYTFIRFLLNRMTNTTQQKKLKKIFTSSALPLIHVFSLFQRNVYYEICTEKQNEYTVCIDETKCLHYYFRKGADRKDGINY